MHEMQMVLSSPSPSILKQSQTEKMNLDDIQAVPRYLFRTYSPKSRGRNGFELITSQLAREGTVGADLSEMDDTAAAQMIREHLTWDDKLEGDDLVSWTSSLLFALQHAIRCNARFCALDPGRIWICVVDTSLFDSRLFRSAAGLMDKYDIHSMGTYRYEPNDLAHEYLIQGTIDIIGKSVTTSLASLIGSGLYTLFPELEIPGKSSYLHTRVLELRAAFFRNSVPTSTKDFARIKSLASKSFRDTWVWPMTIAFLTLRRRKDREIFPLLGIPLSHSDSGHLLEDDSLQHNTYTPQVLEVQQFVRIWKIREDHLKTSVTDELGRPQNSDNRDPTGLEALVENLSLNSN